MTIFEFLDQCYATCSEPLKYVKAQLDSKSKDYSLPREYELFSERWGERDYLGNATKLIRTEYGRVEVDPKTGRLLKLIPHSSIKLADWNELVEVWKGAK